MRLQPHRPRLTANDSTRSRSIPFLNALRGLLASLLVLSVGGGVWATPAFASASTGASRFRAAAMFEARPQRVAVPSYFYPGPPWTQLEASVDQGAHLAIINPNSGPGASIDPDYAAQIASSQVAGLTVLGYVYTDYGRRSPSDVKADIDAYYRWYGVDGIFFDEASNDDDAALVAYYQGIHDYVKAQAGERVVVINPGTRTVEDYLATADIIVTFEGTYDSYSSGNGLPASAWEWDYPADRFWHLVHGTAEADLLDAVDLSKQRNAGWIYVTPDVMPNPWDTLPPSAYWSELLSAATNAGADQACQTPGFPAVQETEFLLYGTITGDGVNFRAGPGLDCDVIGVLSEGETVRILNGSAEADDRTWQMVANEDGVEGWVVADFVEVDDPPAQIVD